MPIIDTATRIQSTIETTMTKMRSGISVSHRRTDDGDTAGCGIAKSVIERPLIVVCRGSYHRRFHRIPGVIALRYNTPYDWSGILNFLRPRAIAGVETVTDDAYERDGVRVTHDAGAVIVSNASEAARVRTMF